ncbi:hypothetical protein BYT27DRAFT_7250019 [Phlegmacium glaucopus]|nr:hypothetical protein BYT27DRAFT_7250019 [Phlegmacium glaucopus]
MECDWNSKKKLIPDNSEDINVTANVPLKKKLCFHEHDTDEIDAEIASPSCGIQHSAQISTPSCPQKGKVKSEINVHSDIKAENDKDEDEISDDWDEEEMQLAFGKSRQISKHDNKFTRGSKSHIADDGDEDLFIDINTKNVMPVPPSKPKKVYLEDFDNFTIKSLPEKDESLFVDVQDIHLRPQYKNLPPSW